jgi:hypothetical protein
MDPIGDLDAEEKREILASVVQSMYSLSVM